MHNFCMIVDGQNGSLVTINTAHDQLEQMTDDRVQDDQPMRRDPEREPDRTGQSQWCPGGLTRSQK